MSCVFNCVENIQTFTYKGHIYDNNDLLNDLSTTEYISFVLTKYLKFIQWRNIPFSIKLTEFILVPLALKLIVNSNNV